MTLLQAIQNAERSKLRICHPELQNGELVTLPYLSALSLPVMLTVSNEWELEARNVTMNEHQVKARLVPVLRKFVPSQKVDEMADAILSEFFLEHS